MLSKYKKESEIRLNMRMLAKQYYEDFIELEERHGKLPKKLSDKIKEIDKEHFINEYPLSTLSVINYRTFWDICLEAGIVHNPFYSDDEEFNSFEKRLHRIITSLMYMPDEKKYTKEDIVKLFKKHKLTS